MLLKKIDEINSRKHLFRPKLIPYAKKSKSLNNTMRMHKDRQRILENQRFVDKLVNVKPVICHNKLKKAYSKQKYFRKQICKNSNKYYHNKFFYENFDTRLNPFLWEDKSDIETMYITNSPMRETMSSSINYDTQDAYLVETRQRISQSRKSRRIKSNNIYSIKLRQKNHNDKGRKVKSRLSRRSTRVKMGKNSKRPFSAAYQRPDLTIKPVDYQDNKTIPATQDNSEPEERSGKIKSVLAQKLIETFGIKNDQDQEEQG
mmetsp:Transcript_20118/g.17818  ORF Transcript_20118/g.17818 Transcript_20118/m.17818 type:complete len:260 (-) Transcript_20118:37-816(-)